MGIGYVSVIWIPCNCSACLRKLYSPWIKSQYNYNQDQYKASNQQCIYWPILGPYNNWKIIHCIDIIKQHKSTYTNINVHTKQNSIRNGALNVGKYVSDNNYGSIPTIDKNTENGYDIF